MQQRTYNPSPLFLKKIYITNSASETKKIGEKLAKNILRNKKNKEAFVLGLRGELGGGKTTFLQGFAKGLGINEKILSPTFIIIRKYELKTKNYKFFYHIDCYRVEEEKEILDLGVKDILKSPWNIIAIEWPERIKKVVPKNTLNLTFLILNKQKRKIIVK